MRGGHWRGGRLAPSQITSGLLRFTCFSPYPIAGFNIGFLSLGLFCTPWFYWARLGILYLGLLSHAAELLRVANRSAVHMAVFCDVYELAQALVPDFLSVSSLQQSPNPLPPLPAWRPQVTPWSWKNLVHLCVHITENSFWIESFVFWCFSQSSGALVLLAHPTPDTAAPWVRISWEFLVTVFQPPKNQGKFWNWDCCFPQERVEERSIAASLNFKIIPLAF